MPTWLDVPRLPAPTAERFASVFVRAGRPAVFTGMLASWPAYRDDLVDHLASRYGHASLPVLRTAGGTLRHDPAKGLDFGTESLGSFVEGLAVDPPPERYLTGTLDVDLPAFAREVPALPLAAGAAWSRRRIWFAPSGAGSPMHRDLPENLYAQLHGRKRFFLFPRAERRRMAPFGVLSGLPNFAAADAERPDDPRWPDFASVPRAEVVLEPGEVLYLPRLVWHQTRALETSFSVNTWFAPGRPLAGLLRAAELYKRLRGLRL